ncbi:hypothetical protein EJB05_57513, partial [Eragrostis curvula]
MSAPPLLLGRLSRAASGFVAKSTSGFHVFRVDGYSLSKTLPGGACVGSDIFSVGGWKSPRSWQIGYYPNGVDEGNDNSDSVSLLLFFHHKGTGNERVQARYRFSLLDAAGNAVYARPAETAIFTSPGHGDDGLALARGYREFIGKQELERQCAGLLKGDSLAILCEVDGVTDVKDLSIQPQKKYTGDDDDDCDDPDYWDERRIVRQQNATTVWEVLKDDHLNLEFRRSLGPQEVNGMNDIPWPSTSLHLSFPAMSPSLLSAAGVGRHLARSASGYVAKAARGFQVFRIDGYSNTKRLPAGERITSNMFYIGGRYWDIDYYPNGADRSKDFTDSISIYLHAHCRGYGDQQKERVRAQYKFSLLDLAGNAAYELPIETGYFSFHGPDGRAGMEEVRCGYDEFIGKEELERRRESLLQGDCLAVRCDVGVMDLQHMFVEPPRQRTGHDDDDDY